MEEPAQHTVLVAHHDSFKRSMLSRAAEHAGLREVGEVATFTDALAMIGLVHPDVVLVDRRTPGLQTLEEVAELAGVASPGALVVVTDEPTSTGALLGAGAVGVAIEDDLGSLAEALDRAVHSLDAERGSGAGRRTGEDRRKEQDWSKVTSERRVADRRSSDDRRGESRGPIADDPAEG